MDAHVQSSHDETARPTRRGGAPSPYPPRWAWLLIAISAGVIAVVRNLDSFDHGVANVVTLIFTFIPALALTVWYSALSSYSRRARLWPLGVLLVCIAVLLAVLRIDRTSGEMLPAFSFRWSPKPDQLLEQPVVRRQASAEKFQPTRYDFPRFLGPRGDLAVTNVELARDWDGHLPKKLWKRKIGAGWSAFSIVGLVAVTLEQRGEEELVTCYDLMSGEPLWAHAIHARHWTTLGGVGPRSTPTIVDGRVYALGATGVLRCLDLQTGKLIWKQELFKLLGLTQAEDEGNVAWGRAASPLVIDKLVVVPAGGHRGGELVSLMAFDAVTGKKVWQGGQQQVAYASPVFAELAGTRQILTVNEASVAGHDAASGKELWTYEWPGTSNMNASSSQAVPLSDDRVFISKGYGGGAAVFRVLKGENGELRTEKVWAQRNLMRTKFTNVVIHDDYVYGLSDGILECISLVDGTRQWKKGRYGHGQILRVRDVLLVLAETGELALVELSSKHFNEIARIQALDGQTWNNLALAGPYLLVRNGEEAACYLLPPKESPPDSPAKEPAVRAASPLK